MVGCLLSPVWLEPEAAERRRCNLPPWISPCGAPCGLRSRICFSTPEVNLSRAWRIEKLAQSSYSVEERDWILRHEMCPVCRYNLLSVAGVWTGFQLSWLEEQILIRTKSPFFAWRLPRLGLLLLPSLRV